MQSLSRPIRYSRYSAPDRSRLNFMSTPFPQPDHRRSIDLCQPHGQKMACLVKNFATRTTIFICHLAVVFEIGSNDAIAQVQSALHEQSAHFLEKHCVDCHSGSQPEGGLDLATGPDDLANSEVRRRWVYLFDRVAEGEMPPESEIQPAADEKARFLATLGESLTHADLASRDVILRRLNRREYTNTVSDLFGIYIDLSRLLSDDEMDQGFDTNGSVLSLGPQQMVQYVRAADLVPHIL